MEDIAVFIALNSRPRSQFFTIRTSQPANNIYIYIYTPVFKNVTTLKMYIKYVYLIYSYQKETLFDKKTKDIIIYFQCYNVIKTGVHICIYLYTYNVYSNYIYSITQTSAESS